MAEIGVPAAIRPITGRFAASRSPPHPNTTTFEPAGQFKAGEKLTLKVGNEEYDMNWNNFSSRYDTNLESPFRYTSGTTAQVMVPGSDDYPAGNVSVLLAEPLFAPPVNTGSGSQPITVTWNGSSDNTSAVLLALNYATSASVGFADFQIVCELSDDGQAAIASSFLTDFRNSPIAYRSLTLTRLRTNEVTLANNTLLHINSQIQINVPLQ